jgi:hypothetical protein
MTEDEAKQRWCPFARVGFPVQGGINRSVGQDGKEGPNWPTCMGSSCMAWRWRVAPTEAREAGREAIQIKDRVHIMEFPAIEAVAGDGYCGLAGSPA